MYVCKLNGIEKTNQYEELIKVFMPDRNYKLIHEEENDEDCIVYDFNGDKDELKRSIYKDLERITGKSPKWGILTGIRPVKLTGEMFDKTCSMETVKAKLSTEYLLHPSKVELVTDILDFQRSTAGKPEENSMAIYLGIPFCPTRCLYCSFTSNQVKDPEIDRYLEALHKEVQYCGDKVKAGKYRVESFYIGGGTPTTLNASQLDELLAKISECFDISQLREFTIEAGRPDTITEEKLQVMKKYGVDRISINPQTMKQETLDLIGRRHTVEETEKAFEMARRVDIKHINADLIAGLPEETFDDFKHSIDKMIEFGAENITIHTLAVKRASRLKEMDEEFNYKDEELREDMLLYAQKVLGEAGYRPYYLYRQKHTSGNTENIGYCKGNAVSIYNIRIMEEAQSILAMGAGGISKVYYPAENRLERVANVSNYEIYIYRIEEMKDRKEKNFWR